MDTKKQKLRPSLELIKITPNPERVKSILHMANLLEERITLQDKEKMAALVTVDYYEIIKELLTAILLLEGYKTLSHKSLIAYLEKNYNAAFGKDEFILMDDTRKLRNDILYYGKQVDKSFLINHEGRLKIIISKLLNMVNKKSQ